MRKFFVLLFAGANCFALTSSQIQKFYAETPLDVRDAYNSKSKAAFSEEQTVENFSAEIFSEKVEKINSSHLIYRPQMTGWTKLVFETIYEEIKGLAELPSRISSPVLFSSHISPSIFQDNTFEIALPLKFSKIPRALFVFLFSLSILSIHRIKFRLFIQRE